MSTLLDLVEHFQSISGVSIEKHLLATPSDVNVKAAFRTFDIAVTGKGWDVIKAEVEKNTQNLFDDCDSMIFDGLPLETSEPYTPRQVFIAVIYAVLVVNGKNGVPSSLNSLLVEIHKTTRDLRGLPSRERRLDLVIGQLFQRIITILAYAQSKPSSRFSLSSRAGYDLVHHPDVQEQLRHIRWLVDDLQWGFGDFAAVFTQKFPSPLPLNNYPWPRSEFLHQTKVRLRELHGLPRGEGEAKRFQAAFGRLMEVIDGLVPRLDEFEERIIGSTYHEVDCLLQAAKETGSSRELASNVLCEISRCLCKFSHAPNTPKNKIAFARSIVVTLHVLRMLPSTIRNHAARLTVVSAMSKISVLNIEEKLSLNHEGVASLIGDLRSLTVRLDSGENDKGQVFTSMWEEALKNTSP
ncbi:hypothetical protein DL96DRAFT_207093 [Flagelloscypha sp. PMI_526]|nr:hypothetical protein DL96DRAFT_207093 [Flagelloscypha sp. PMI_526]